MSNTSNHNPDVLTCLANLSNDEVFTPPSLANKMLDLLPSTIWSDEKATFLDPVCKTGVFLREIAKRLDNGLETQIPDRQARINHILTNQLFGIAITELTSLLSRRSVYCSKTANGKYSVCASFNDQQGNIRFERLEHSWQSGRCRLCGTSQKNYERGEELESHAYQFIHCVKPEEIFNMKFDVIVGNPPYQLGDGSGLGSGASPIYQHFVHQAKKLNPRFLCMIIPSRWFAGGRSLDEFRKEMLKDNRIRILVDFPDSVECFPGVDLSGGVSYFLWDRDNRGNCEVTSILGGSATTLERPLLEEGLETFIRYNEATSILRNVRKLRERSFAEIVSANDPYGFDVRVENSYRRVKPKYSLKPSRDSVAFYYNGWRRLGLGFIKRSAVQRNADWVDRYKVYISQAYGERGGLPYLVLPRPFIGEKNTCCTETYLVIGPVSSKKTANNVISYVETKFFRFLVLLIKNTQHGVKKVYSLVPMQDFSKPWKDEELYAKYNLAKAESEFIEKMIRPMEVASD